MALKIGIGGNSGRGGGGASSADKVSYDNTTSGLQSTNVQDAIDEVGANLGEIGVISQTLTWKGNATNPIRYTISNVVKGYIPTLLINKWKELWTSDVCYRHGFNRDTGYFFVNGLDDISATEAEMILSNITFRKVFSADYSRGGDAGFNLRTIIIHMYLSEYDYTNQNVRKLFLNCNELESVYLRTDSVSTTDITQIFYNCKKLKEVRGSFKLNSVTTTTSAFYNCFALKEVRMEGLSSDISFSESFEFSLESVVYLIINSKRYKNPSLTTTLTMHLHEQAYNRAFDDETEYTWNGQTYYGILELAEAVGVSIVYP